MKATSIFGGVQGFQIIIQIIRSKFVAVLLGPTGIGILGLLTSTIGLITGLTNFGLGTSAVKDIAESVNTRNQIRIATTAALLRRLVWITGILGALITLILSPWLSQLTFGNHKYTLAFIWVSITLLFNQLTVGQLVILQGMRKLQYLAKANLAGSLLALLVTVPLYYLWGVGGIVPAIIGTSIITMAVSWYYAGKVRIESVKVSRDQIITDGKKMLFMGFMISLSGLVALGGSYIIRIFISNHGGVEQVGLYNAGFAIINSYVGLIFTAMATDYYPRLSAQAGDNNLCRQTINQQAEIAVLILAPILSVFLIFINWIILILYSQKFLVINGMIYWATLGIYFKAASWSIAFILLAKGKNTLFFWNELISNIYFLGLNILGYKLLGLMGLGLSYLLGYLLYLIQVFFLSRIKFEFSFNLDFVRIFGIQFLLAIGGFIAVKFLSSPLNYIAGLVLISVSSWYSIKELDKRIGLQSIFLSIKSKLNMKN
jgi:O-antigen/teichoic acid export membrane protein